MFYLQQSLRVINASWKTTVLRKYQAHGMLLYVDESYILFSLVGLLLFLCCHCWLLHKNCFISVTETSLLLVTFLDTIFTMNIREVCLWSSTEMCTLRTQTKIPRKFCLSYSRKGSVKIYKTALKDSELSLTLHDNCSSFNQSASSLFLALYIVS